LEKSIYAVHLTLSKFIPECELDHDDSKQLAEAYAEVARHYPNLELPAKYLAIGTLVGVTAGIYGPRFGAWKMRRAMERPRRGPTAPQSPTSPTAPSQHLMPQADYQVNGHEAPRQQPREVPPELRRSEIPGVGTVEFGEDHPLVRGKPN
jgi:hypothetical protein